MKSVEEMKYVLLNEWTDDPPAGCTTYYYPVLFKKVSDTLSTIDEIVEHVKVASGYDDLDDYDEDELDEDILEEIEGLDPRTKNGYIRTDSLINWEWDNGGTGCGCITYAEGSDIPEAIASFYEENLRDDLEEPDFEFYDEMDDDEEVDVDFTVTICLGKGDGGEVSVSCPVSVKELKNLAYCALEGIEVSDCDDLADLVERISSEAISEADDLEDDEATCIIANPIDIEEYNTFTADFIVEYAKEHNDNPEVIELLAEMIEELSENYNESLW